MLESIDNKRLETFFDGVTAIAITLLILEIKIPELGNIHSLYDLGHELLSEWPSWLAFMLTFLTLFIAWANHHHMSVLLDNTSNAYIYANCLMLITIVVFPFATGLLGRFLDTEYFKLPIIVYCAVNLVHAISWWVVFRTSKNPIDLAKNADARKKLDKTSKVIAFSCLYNFSITVLAFWFPIISLCLVTVAWLYYLFAGLTYTSLENKKA
jgi:uncharacterized membrane protein